MKRPKERLHKVIVIGATPSGIAATNKLGELGIPVTLLDKDANIDKKLSREEWRLKNGISLNYAHRPGIMRIFRNPGIKCLLPVRINSIKHNQQGFTVGLTQDQTFVDQQQCILCGRCLDVCPVSDGNGEKAIKFEGRFSIPGRPIIDKRRAPLCGENCPLGVNAQGYIALAKAGKYIEALNLIREKNILPGICGRVCTHPCENDCRRGLLDETVSIRAVKRFLADYGAQHPEKVNAPAPVEKRPEKFAVIGSGPAGIAAAAELARFGCNVTIFEKEKQGGGLLRYGIGAHRLPRNILDAELDYIQKLGVKFELGHPVNFSNDLEPMQKDFDAIIITTGAWNDRQLGIRGEDLDGVYGCLSFLTRFYREEITIKKGEKAAVIGDGNAAFDLARTLIRAGADVTIVSWFDMDLIPADPEEIKGAADEGIALIAKSKVMAFEGENNKLRRLVMKYTKPGPPDQNGIEWPVVVKDSEERLLEVDKAFVAIGQTGQSTECGKISVNESGYMNTNDNRLINFAKIFAAGDAVSGPSTVVDAMARGKATAERILSDICKITMSKKHHQRPQNRDFPEIPRDIPTQNRVTMPEKQPVARKDNFSEVALGLSESQVIYETSRCLQCGVCSECMQCVDVCSAIGAINHDQTEIHQVENAGIIILADPEMAPQIGGEDVIRAYGPKSSKTDIYAMMMRGYSAAAQAMVMIGGASLIQKGQGLSFYQPDLSLTRDQRIGVFVCKCAESLGWLPDMDLYVEKLSRLENVAHSEVMESACIPGGISSIVKTVRDKGLTRLVLGSCVCCALNFYCSACTDQRSRLKYGLFNATGITASMVVTRNIRGESLTLLKKDPAQAMSKFEGLLDRSVKAARNLEPFSSPARNYNFAAAVIGDSEAAVQSASILAKAGMDIFMFANGDKPPEITEQFPNIHCFENTVVNQISGTLGDFTIDIQSGNFVQSIHAGAVILGEKSRKKIAYVHQNGMKSRSIICSMQEKDMAGIPFFYPGMTSIAGLFLCSPPGIRISERQKGEAAAVLAAAVMPRGPRKSKGYTVVIDKEICRNCGRCVAACPYQAITLHENDFGGWYASVDEAFCKGCGNCISVCPSNAADSPYRSQKFFEQTLENILLQA
jgi:NADPH-dependent glutamate synthase beta subunit-like oxidoreductase/NAD-dependent dihydropyrimidine dehydrogenase PreA subunit